MQAYEFLPKEERKQKKKGKEQSFERMSLSTDPLNSQRQTKQFSAIEVDLGPAVLPCSSEGGSSTML